ncbi:uncharacterized protein atf7ip2 isoform X1 [Platichthys flesus]|uniref:uncharacterized protein atf7ip2 isoform X1 n=2 Tax=Platichthys flesus TaxID=8260 RepID=UPI002DB96C8D|nr:uncharacterized protein atf7ip2 isoform X1 [Platichthys flesus]XP_062264710.1 uncharacterized protein atf7ip2 isoform X1 [Platichthys flesus]
MAEVQDQNKDCRGFKKSRRATADHSTKAKKCSTAAERNRGISKQRSRVNIGLAFKRWRDLKAAKGLKTDTDVALCLLDKMKPSPSTSTSSGDADKMMKISLSEMKALIKKEVRNEAKRNENKLKVLIETSLDLSVDYEKNIQKLEARINTLTKRAEGALVHMTNLFKKSPQRPPDENDVIRIDSGDEPMETMSQTDVRDCTETIGEFFQEMKTSENALKKMRSDNEDLKAALGTPRAVTANESQRNVKITEKRPEAEEQREKKTDCPKKTKECVSLNNINNSEDSEQDKLSYPPLPPAPFPSTLSIEAAEYNIPQRLNVHLALIREPQGLSVLWKVGVEDPLAPPMDSYSVYIAVERQKGSSYFPKWIFLGELKAIQLPMCVMIKKYKPGHKVCVTVVGKDRFGRYGSYSEVVTAAIPE